MIVVHWPSRPTAGCGWLPRSLRGRIQGALTIVLTGGPQLAGLLHGFAGTAVGTRTAAGVGGLLTMVTVAAILLTVPQLWSYQPDQIA